MKARDCVALAVAIVALTSLPARAEMAQIAVAQQYGISYLPFMLMEEKKLIEKHAKATGVDVKVGWAKFAGGNVMNDALLSGNLQFASGGVGPFLTLWARTRGNLDVRGVAASGYELAPLLREIGDINLELYGQNVIVAVFGMGERGLGEAPRLVRALRAAVQRVGLDPGGARASFAAPPPWGELAMTPREAYLGAQEVVPASQAAGRIVAESLATYPPGIPNVLPGERLTGETLAYVQRTLELGGSVRGASDRLLRTVRVVVEGR